MSHIKKILTRMLPIIEDLLLLIGLSFISGGVFLIYYPAGYIVIGLGLISFAVLLARRNT
ncbi:hypothetical protein SAMN04490355_104028 [Pelosinus propionicus DSM 13327]|uniref:Uncharacterized protein n=1 Tax=Pelosinus propionicus DSM 13327 TaxID=1123291 RepID=A0A1I4N1R2_9FIRM|nr:hypothetical protein SAMN04490355_104028 [Pelosinus propionicus DSM 13327]